MLLRAAAELLLHVSAVFLSVLLHAAAILLVALLVLAAIVLVALLLPAIMLVALLLSGALLFDEILAHFAHRARHDVFVPRLVAASHCVFGRRVVLMTHLGLGSRLTFVIFPEVVATRVAVVPIFVRLLKIEYGPVALTVVVVAIVIVVAVVAVSAGVVVVIVVVTLEATAVAVVIVIVVVVVVVVVIIDVVVVQLLEGLLHVPRQLLTLLMNILFHPLHPVSDLLQGYISDIHRLCSCIRCLVSIHGIGQVEHIFGHTVLGGVFRRHAVSILSTVSWHSFRRRLDAIKCVCTCEKSCTGNTLN